MELSQLSALALFAFVSTFTPGPNNIMLMTSGANVGFVRTIPHMLGITLGFAVMVMLIGVGLMGLFHSYPLSHQILKYLSLSYLVYLAAKIAFSGKASERKDFKPMSFLQAASFSFWTAAGTQLQRWLTTHTRVRSFNISMALLLLLSTLPMLN